MVTTAQLSPPLRVISRVPVSLPEAVAMATPWVAGGEADVGDGAARAAGVHGAPAPASVEGRHDPRTTAGGRDRGAGAGQGGAALTAGRQVGGECVKPAPPLVETKATSVGLAPLYAPTSQTAMRSCELEAGESGGTLLGAAGGRPRAPARPPFQGVGNPWIRQVPGQYQHGLLPEARGGLRRDNILQG